MGILLLVTRTRSKRALQPPTYWEDEPARKTLDQPFVKASVRREFILYSCCNFATDKTGQLCPPNSQSLWCLSRSVVRETLNSQICFSLIFSVFFFSFSPPRSFSLFGVYLKFSIRCFIASLHNGLIRPVRRTKRPLWNISLRSFLTRIRTREALVRFGNVALVHLRPRWFIERRQINSSRLTRVRV